MTAVRSTAQRIADALRRLETEPNVWVATASPDGLPHLVPLSLAWDGTAILVTTPTEAVTVRNARASGRARASLDSADDVVIADAHVTVEPLATVPSAILDEYTARVGWDPRNESGAWSLLRLVLRRVQAWNGVHEISGRTVMRDGIWVA